MKTTYWLLALMLAGTGNVSLSAVTQDKAPAAAAQSSAPAPAGHKPPPQAYTDCQGKKAGDKIQHTTREGPVPATCDNSPEGLVARPVRPKAPPP